MVNRISCVLPAGLVAGLMIAGSVATARPVRARTAAGDPPAADCQPFGGRPCLLPFPDNLFTRPDRSSRTGLRVSLPAGAMPISTNEQRVSVAPYDRADGFSPGSAAILHVPGLDNAAAFARTGAAGVLDMAKSLRKSQPIVIIDEQTGRRQLIWSELDANAKTPQTTDLLIHGGKDFVDGHTYVVALRNLRTAAGHLIRAPKWFELLRDNRPLPQNERSQSARYARIFAALARAGVRRANLYEAWDFTVASRQNVTDRLLSIRNSAFAQLGDRKLADGLAEGRAPSYTITSTKTISPQLSAVVGTFDVPCYLIQCGTTATTGFHYSSRKPDAVPTQIPGNVAAAPFECVIPSTAGNPTPARVSLYGHGLFGDYTEVEDPWVEALATQYNMVFCGTDWWGLTQEDEPFAATVVSNLNLFGVIVDRLQQAVLNTLFLGRLMISPHGFASNPDFQVGGRPVIDTSHLYYNGNSQGGIMGGVTLAVSPDVQAGGARRHRDGLRQPAARAEHGLHDVQHVSRIHLHRPVDVPGDPRSARPVVGSRRPRRVRAVHDLTSAARRPVAPGADAGRLRRLPGQHVLRRGRGANRRGVRIRAGAGSRSVARSQPVLRHPGDRALSVRRVGDRDLGQRARPRAGAAGREQPADRERDEHRPAPESP